MRYMLPKGSPRNALLAAVADYLLEHGLSNLSLRPLAAATGTSARMLVYHFGSKERLIAEAMAEIRSRQQALVAGWVRRHPKASFADLMGFAWAWIAAAEREPYLRLFLEVLGRGTPHTAPFAEFCRATFEEWVRSLERRLETDGLSPGAARDLAVLTVSTMRGLALYSLATMDKRGARLALRAFTRAVGKTRRRK